ncbi:outer membrane protein transport protein [bacterium]|nr:outer membrane protein transport protein [bacterium]
MKKREGIALLVALTVLACAAAFASNGTQIGTVGARSTAMGSAFRGLADDWSAVYFNPAGLTQLDAKWTIGASAGYLMPRGSYQAYAYPTNPFAGLSTAEVDAAARNFLVPAFSIFYKASEKLTAGLGVYAPNGLGTEWNLMSVPASYGNTGAISKENEFFSDHQVIDIAPTVAYQITDKLSVGLGLKYTIGKMAIDQVMLPQTRLIMYQNAGGALQLAQIDQLLGGIAQIGAAMQNPVDPSRIMVENNLEGDGSAMGANLGLLFKVSEKLSIGVSGRYSTDLKLKGTYKLTAGMPNYQAQIDALAAADPVNVGPYAPTLKATFNGQNQSFGNYEDVEAELPLPLVVGGGIAFKPSERLTLTADATYTNWSAWDEVKVMKDDVELNSLGLDWENTIEIGAGVEWLAKQMECKSLFLRLGGYTVNSPVPNTTMNPTLLDPARRYVVTAGVGLAMGKIVVDLAYERVIFGEKDIPASEYDPGESGHMLNYAGIYNFNANVFTLGVSVGL